jgi:hypothetical protein
VPALFAAAGGFIFEKLDETSTLGTGYAVNGLRLPITAVLSWTSHGLPPEIFATEDTERMEK